MVSSDLDLRSLEQVSLVSFTKNFQVSVYLFFPIFQVSRGLFVCSRDNEIWKLACLRYATFKLHNFAIWMTQNFVFPVSGTAQTVPQLLVLQIIETCSFIVLVCNSTVVTSVKLRMCGKERTVFKIQIIR